MDPLVVLSFVIAILLEIVVPLAVAGWLVRRFALPWRIFLYGALFFILVQAIHTPLVLLTQTPMVLALNEIFPDRTVALAVFAIILGLLAGLFEEIGRYVIFRWFFRPRRIPLSTENGLLFGAGWGGVESMLIGGLVFLTLLSYITAVPLTDARIEEINQSLGGTLTEEQIAAIEAQNQALLNLTPLDPLVGLLERLMVFPVQIAFTLLVLFAVVQGRPLLLLLAILWHTVLDALAVFLGATAGLVAAEATVAVSAVIALAFIWYTWPGSRGNRLQEP